MFARDIIPCQINKVWKLTQNGGIDRKKEGNNDSRRLLKHKQTE